MGDLGFGDFRDDFVGFRVSCPYHWFITERFSVQGEGQLNHVQCFVLLLEP